MHAPARRRRWRTVLLAVAGFCALIVALLLVLPALVSLDSVKAKLVAHAEQALQRQVEVGRLRLRLLPWLGASVEGLAVHNPPGWQHPTLVEVDRVAIRVALLPLLRRTVEVRSLVLSRGTLVLERDARGRTNYEDLLAPPPSPSQAPGTSAPAGLPAALLVSQLLLRDVDVTFIDRHTVPGQALTTTVRDVQATVSQRAVDLPLEFDLSAAVLSEGERNLRLRGRFGPLPPTLDVAQVPLRLDVQAEGLVVAKLAPYLGPSLPLRDGRLSVALQVTGTLGTRLEASGTITLAQAVFGAPGEAAPPLPPVRLALAAGLDRARAQLELTRLQLELAPLQATLAGRVQQIETAPQLDVRLETNPVALGELFSRLPALAAALPPAAEVKGQAQLQGTLQGTLQRLRAEAELRLPHVSLRSGPFRGAGEGSGMRLEATAVQGRVQARLVAAQPPEVTFDVQAQQLHFDQQAAAGATPAAAAPPTPATRPGVPPLTLRGTVRVEAAQLKQLQVQQLVAEVALVNGKLQSTQRFAAYGGTFAGQLQANLVPVEPDVALAVRVADVKTADLLNALTPTKNLLLGTLSSEVVFRGKGLAWEALSRTLTGTGKVRITGVQLTTLDLLPKLALGLQGVSRLAGFSVPQALAAQSFDTLQAAVNVVQGKILTDALRLTGKDVEVEAKGVLGLDGSLAFTGRTLLRGELARAFGPRAAFLQDGEGRIALPFTVAGTVTQPRVALDEAALMQRAKAAVAEKVQEKAGTALQKLLDKPLPGLTPEPAPPAAPEESKPLQQLQRSLKGLFKR
ncbi:MAG: hypothetical protein KatS3mg131_3317 [Candidatus Tectimicrobiota bacterium]|nr:MAG: hypothetical protein KatS3mg131_3317 [Candidatus Tectomicrobia bacterium]